MEYLNYILHAAEFGLLFWLLRKKPLVQEVRVERHFVAPPLPKVEPTIVDNSFKLTDTLNSAVDRLNELSKEVSHDHEEINALRAVLAAQDAKPAPVPSTVITHQVIDPKVIEQKVKDAVSEKFAKHLVQRSSAELLKEIRSNPHRTKQIAAHMKESGETSFRRAAAHIDAKAK